MCAHDVLKLADHSLRQRQSSILGQDGEQVLGDTTGAILGQLEQIAQSLIAILRAERRVLQEGLKLGVLLEGAGDGREVLVKT